MVRTALALVVALAGCSAQQGDVPARGPEDAGPVAGGAYTSEGPKAGVPCGEIPWPVPSGDGSVTWEVRYVPCSGGPWDPVSDHAEDQDFGTPPAGFSPRPPAPGDPVPW